jgi:hypothetical protein
LAKSQDIKGNPDCPCISSLYAMWPLPMMTFKYIKLLFVKISRIPKELIYNRI